MAPVSLAGACLYMLLLHVQSMRTLHQRGRCLLVIVTEEEAFSSVIYGEEDENLLRWPCRPFIYSMTCMAPIQVYAAAALIEWHGEKADTVPRKIFELGLQSFEAVAEYVLTYAEFLWGLGDYDNMRALFERALAADSKTKKLWDRYIQVSITGISVIMQAATSASSNNLPARLCFERCLLSITGDWGRLSATYVAPPRGFTQVQQQASLDM